MMLIYAKGPWRLYAAGDNSVRVENTELMCGDTYTFTPNIIMCEFRSFTLPKHVHKQITYLYNLYRTYRNGIYKNNN